MQGWELKKYFLGVGWRGWALIQGWALINFFYLQGGRLVKASAYLRWALKRINTVCDTGVSQI